MTPGHAIIYKEKSTKARYIPKAKRINSKNEEVYTICTQKHVPILVNGLEVMTWGIDEFNEMIKNKNLKWRNN